MTTGRPTRTRGKRGELPKPMIRQGTLGLMPFNAVTASYLQAGLGELILGYRDTEETTRLKTQTSIQLAEPGQPRKSQPVDLNGRFFNSFTDALYRGKLPQVILMAPQPDEWQTLLVDVVEYFDKLLSMGFFIPKKEIIKRDPVEDFIPCMVLTGQGIVFSNFITGLVRYVEQLGQRHPSLTEEMRTRILGKFLRGMAADDGVLTPDADAPMERVPVARRIKIAGGSGHATEVIQGVFSMNSLVAVVENRVKNGAERLELEHAWLRLSRTVLPTVADPDLASQLQQSILALGRQRQAFDETDGPEALPTAPFATAATAKKKNTGMTAPPSPTRLSAVDALILAGLCQTAERAGLTDERRLFEALARQVVQRCQG